MACLRKSSPQCIPTTHHMHTSAHTHTLHTYTLRIRPKWFTLFQEYLPLAFFLRVYIHLENIYSSF